MASISILQLLCFKSKSIWDYFLLTWISIWQLVRTNPLINEWKRHRLSIKWSVSKVSTLDKTSSSFSKINFSSFIWTNDTKQMLHQMEKNHDRGISFMFLNTQIFQIVRINVIRLILSHINRWDPTRTSHLCGACMKTHAVY